MFSTINQIPKNVHSDHNSSTHMIDKKDSQNNILLETQFEQFVEKFPPSNHSGNRASKKSESKGKNSIKSESKGKNSIKSERQEGDGLQNLLRPSEDEQPSTNKEGSTSLYQQW